MRYIVGFDFSLKSTGAVLLPRDGSKVPRLDRALKTDWSGSQWWAPQRYLAFFRDLSSFMQESLEIAGAGNLDLAAEAVVWEKETTPALFALHTAYWDWAWKLRTRMIYLTYQRWRNLLIEREKPPKEEVAVEGKSLARLLFTRAVGRKPASHDVSDAWGVATAAERFYNYADGIIGASDLSVKEGRFFDSSRKTKGISFEAGILNERNTNYFDWREKNGSEEKDQN